MLGAAPPVMSRAYTMRSHTITKNKLCNINRLKFYRSIWWHLGCSLVNETILQDAFYRIGEMEHHKTLSFRVRPLQ